MLTPLYARLGLENLVPKFELAEQEMAPSTAYSIIHGELMLDGNTIAVMVSGIVAIILPGVTQALNPAGSNLWTLIGALCIPRVPRIGTRFVACIIRWRSSRWAMDASSTGYALSAGTTAEAKRFF